MSDEAINITIREDGSRVVQRNLEDIGTSAQKSQTNIDQLKNSLKGGSNDLQSFINSSTGVSRELKSAADSADVFSKALNGTPLQQTKKLMNDVEKQAVSSKAVFEGLVLVHEGLIGNFKRMISSLLIEAQAMAGVEKTTAAVSFLMQPLALGIIAVTLATIAGTVAFLAYAEAHRKVIDQALGLGAASGATVAMINEEAKAAAYATAQTEGWTKKSVQAFAAVGVQSGATREQLAELVPAYASLTNTKPEEAQKQLAEAMRDAGKGAEEMASKVSFLSGQQLEQIQTLERLGDHQAAVNLLVKYFKDYTDQAQDAGAKYSSVLHTVGATAANVAGQIWQVVQAMLALDNATSGAKTLGQPAPLNAAAVIALQKQAALKADSKGGVALVNATPEAQELAQRQALQGQINLLKKAQAADLALGNSAQYQKDTVALGDYTRALATYRTELEKKTAVDELDAQIETAKRAHNATRVGDLERQKTLVQQSGVVESQADANALANAAAKRAAASVSSGPKFNIDTLRTQLAGLLTKVDPVEAGLLKLAKDQDVLAKATDKGIISTDQQKKYLAELKAQSDQDILGPLIAKADPTRAALVSLGNEEKRLKDARAAGLVTAEQEVTYLARLKKAYAEATDPLKYMNDELDAQIKLAAEDQRNKEIDTDLRSRVLSLQKSGIDLDVTETANLRAKLVVMQQTNEAQAAQNQLLGASVDKRRQQAIDAKATGDLLKDPKSGFTKNDAFNAANAATGGLFDGTQQAMNAQIAAFQDMYRQIDLYRQADVANEASAAQAKAKVDAMYSELRLKNADSFFGELAKLSSSKNKEIAAIGKAAAVAQATIDGILAVQKTLSAYPAPWNYAMAGAVAVTTAANIASIISTNMATGGTMMVPGSGGVDTQLVGIRASPGEMITVQTPTQVRHGNAAVDAANGGQAAPPTVNLRNINVIDPKEALTALDTADGERVITNIIQRNRSTYRRILGNS